MAYGSFWMNCSPMTIWRQYLAGCGTNVAALSFGGQTYNFSPHTEEYNGITWTQVSSMNCFRFGLSGSGTQNAALAFGGTEWAPVWYCVFLVCMQILDIFTTYRTTYYDGTSWWEDAGLIIETTHATGCGDANDTFCIGGRRGRNSGLYGSIYYPNDIVERYNGITWSWSFAPPLLTGSEISASCGTANAALVFGGNHGSYSMDAIQRTESFNGTFWCVGGNLVVGRHSLAGSGTQDAGLSFGGTGLAADQPDPFNLTHGTEGVTEEYFGDVWSMGGKQIHYTKALAGCGACDALSFGGSGLSSWGEYGPCGYTEVYSRALTSIPSYGPIDIPTTGIYHI